MQIVTSCGRLQEIIGLKKHFKDFLGYNKKPAAKTPLEIDMHDVFNYEHRYCSALSYLQNSLQSQMIHICFAQSVFIFNMCVVSRRTLKG